MFDSFSISFSPIIKGFVSGWGTFKYNVSVRVSYSDFKATLSLFVFVTLYKLKFVYHALTRAQG